MDITLGAKKVKKKKLACSLRNPPDKNKTVEYPVYEQCFSLMVPSYLSATFFLDKTVFSIFYK